MKHSKIAIAVCFTALLGACGETETAETHLNQAKTYINNNQLEQSVISLKNAIRLAPKSAEARYLLGKMYLSLGRADEAAKELERAIKYKHDVSLTLPLLARAYMLTESDEDIVDLEALSSGTTDQAKAQYLAYKTYSLLRLDKKEEAQQVVEQVVALQNTKSYGALASAYLAYAEQAFEQAIEFASTSIEEDAKNADAIMLYGQISMAQNNYEAAVEKFRAYAELQPQSAKIQLFLADALVKADKFEEAEAIADEILAGIPNQPFANYIKAVSRFEEKDHKLASQHAELAITNGYAPGNLKLLAGASAFYLKNYEQANSHLESLVKYLPQAHPARKMLAFSQLKLGLINEVGETVEGYEPTSEEDSQFLSSLSIELLGVGAVTEAKQIAEQARGNESSSAEQQAREGLLKLMMNDSSGLDSLEEALKLDPDLVAAELTLAFASVLAGDLERARQISEKWKQNHPEKSGGFNLEGAILLKEKNLDQAKASFEKSLEKEPENIYALTELTKIAYIQNDLEQAKLLSQKALSINPDNVKVLRQHVGLNTNEVGLTNVKAAYERNLTDITYAILYAETLVKLEQPKEAVKVLERGVVDAKTPKSYWQVLINAHTKLKDKNAVHAVVEKWRKTSPYHIEPVILLAEYWARKGSVERAIVIINDAFEQHPKHQTLTLVKMQLLLDSEKLEEAKILYNTMKSMDIEEVIRNGIEGRIALLEKEFEEAVIKLKLFQQARPSALNTMLLAGACNANGQTREAIKLLEGFLKKEPENMQVKNVLANYYLSDDKYKAIKQYEALIAKQPKNVIVLNNLAWLYMEEGKLDSALKYAEQAYELAPQIANVVDTYSKVLLQNDNKREALAKAKDAYDLSEGKDVDIALNYVEVLLANKWRNEAIDKIKSIDTTNEQQELRKQALIERIE